MSDYEISCLACAAASPRIASKILAIIEPSDMLVYEHQVVLSTIRDMLAEGDAIDDITLPANLRNEGFEEDVLRVAAKLPFVAAGLDSVSNGVDYAELVLEDSLRRTLSNGVDASLSSHDVDAQVSSLETLLYSVRSRMVGDQVVNTYDQTSILRPLDSLVSVRDSESDLPYPLPSMRREYGSYEKGRYSIVAGYSGDGKTTFAFQWVEELCVAGARVGIFEMEMTGTQCERLIIAQGGALTTKQMKGIDPISDEDRERHEDRRKLVSSWSLDIRTGGTTPEQIRAEQMRNRWDVVVVDHLQKFERTRDGEYADLNRYSSQLHRISRDLGCSVILLSQLQKPKDGWVEPHVGNLRGTSGMVEDADEVMMVYAHRIGGMRKADGSSSLIVGKMRDGAGDAAVPLRLDRGRVRFVEVEHRPDPVLPLTGGFV